MGGKPNVPLLILDNIVDTISRNISGQLQWNDVVTWSKLSKQVHCEQTQAAGKNKACGIKIAFLHVPDSR
jgi:hypothetical protein